MLGIEKAAILMMMLKDDTVIKDIFSKLDANEIYEISLAMTNLGRIDSEKVERVLIEFSHDLNQSLEIVGNVKTTEKFLKRILDEGQYDDLLDKLKHANVSSTWEMLANLDDVSIAQFLKNEYPQTSAVVLSKLPSYKSARVLKLLSQEYAIEVLRRMMYLDSVKHDTLKNIERVIENEIVDVSSSLNKEDNSKVIAEIFNNFSKSDEQIFMGALKEKDPDSAERISKSMLSFEDLIFVKDDGINTIIKKIDNNTLVIALAGASDVIQNLFLNTMSQRVARMITDEISAGTRYTKKEIYDAQTRILKIVKAMIADGVIIIDKNLNT